MPQATLVSAATVRRFLQAQNVTIAADNSGSIAARNAVVRVICVRR
jgi:hypothetical protein